MSTPNGERGRITRTKRREIKTKLEAWHLCMILIPTGGDTCRTGLLPFLERAISLVGGTREL